MFLVGGDQELIDFSSMSTPGQVTPAHKPFNKSQKSTVEREFDFPVYTRRIKGLTRKGLYYYGSFIIPLSSEMKNHSKIPSLTLLPYCVENLNVNLFHRWSTSIRNFTMI